jgi:hypothetical protein
MDILNHNLTIDPAAFASAVLDPEIVDVIDLTSGDILSSREFIESLRYDVFVETRVNVLERMKSEKPLYACALCSTPVYIVASPNKRFFFRHRTEDGSCPAKTRAALTQDEILARKYHGLRESEAHKNIKARIEQSLAADPQFQPEGIIQERRWRSENDPSQWRRPDVQAVCNGQRLAFEAQLSTTFLNVVVDRRSFYREEGALLVWVLRRFDPNDRRLMVDDLLFSNNSNILVVDDETTQISKTSRTFHIRCHYRQISLEGNQLLESWDQQVVSFHKLVRDAKQQQCYLFDFKGEKSRHEAATDRKIRENVFDLWKNIAFPYETQALQEWEKLRATLGEQNILIPEKPHGDKSFRAMMHSLLSAQYGSPFGWDFKSLIEVAHYIAESFPEHLLAFGYATEYYNHKALLESQDTSGKWRAKRERIRERIKERDQKYMPDEKWLPTLSFLFPEVGERLKSFLQRQQASPG